MTSPVPAKTAEITIYLHNYKLVNYNMKTAEFRQFEGVKVHGFLAKTAEIRQFNGIHPFMTPPVHDFTPCFTPSNPAVPWDIFQTRWDIMSAWDISWDISLAWDIPWDINLGKLRYFLDKQRYWHRGIFSNLRQVEIFLRQGEILVPWDIFKHEASWDIFYISRRMETCYHLSVEV